MGYADSGDTPADGGTVKMATLGAISFGDPVMLVGALAALVPVVLHLLNRMRSPEVLFPTLRFLRVTAQKTARRRRVQQWFLLLLRMAVFALIAMALAVPLIKGGSSGLAYGFIGLFLVGIALVALAAVMIGGALDQAAATKRSRMSDAGAEAENVKRETRNPVGSYALSAIIILLAIAMMGAGVFGLGSDRFFSTTAGGFGGTSTVCAIIFDNSQSMLVRQDSASRLDRAKDALRQLLLDTVRPAEACLLPTNIADVTSEGLTTDLGQVLGEAEKLESRGKARAMRDRVRSAIGVLSQSRQPTKMLVIISDLQRGAFSDAEVFSQVASLPETQVILLHVGGGQPVADVGIESFTVSAGQAVVGNQVEFETAVVNNSDGAEVKDLELLVDGQVVPGVHASVQMGAAGNPAARETARFSYRLTQAGAHRFTVRLADGHDAMAWDDARDLVLNVADRVRVLVAGAEPALRARSLGYFVGTALNPYGEGKGAWGIAPDYVGIGGVGRMNLAGYAAVFVCDVPAVDATGAENLKRYVQAGGRVCLFAGPAVDSAAWNAELGRRQLLPGALVGPTVGAAGVPVDFVDTSSDVFKNLFETQEPWRSIVVTGHWGLAGNSTERGRVLGKLADGSPIMTDHVVGTGEVYTVLTSTSGGWCNMATTVPFLPMLVRIALGDSGKVHSGTSAEPGEVVELAVPAGTAPTMSVDVTSPAGGAPLNIMASKDEEAARWVFNQTLHAGVYTWATRDGKSAGEFVINEPGNEVELASADVDAVAKSCPAKPAVIVAQSVQELTKKLRLVSEGTSLMPGVLAGVMVMVVLEALMANRTGNRKPAAEAAPGVEPLRHMAAA